MLESHAVRRFYWAQVYSAVALTSFGTLLLELSITRLFSVLLYYHFAFLAISIALFGLGIGGVLSYPVAAWRGSNFSKMGGISLLNSVLVLCMLLFILSRGGRLGFSTLLEFYISSSVPFLFTGIVLSLAISETIEKIDRVYFADLLGAGVSCLVLVPLLNRVGGPSTIISSGVLYAASSVIWYALAGKRKAGYVLASSIATALLLLVIYNARHSIIDVKYAKGGPVSDEVFVGWNSFSRVALRRHAPESYSIDIDADANTYIANYNFNSLSETVRSQLLHTGRGAAYLLRPGAKTLIIGPGGGVDVSRALASNSRDITGVEINPIIAETIMRKRYPALSQNLYFRPEIRIVVEDGRSYVHRSRETYQVIQATLVDTWASTASGAFALSENSLYTIEAFQDYLSHLSPDGIVSFTRWGVEPPRESLRLLALGQAALERLGEREYQDHFIVLRERPSSGEAWGSLDTVLIARKPFAQADVQLITNLATQTGAELLYAPGRYISGPFSDRLLARDPAQFQRSYPYDISPVDDDRPFFFYTVRLKDTLTFLSKYIHSRKAKSGAADYKINVAMPVLLGSIAVSIVATALILILPPMIAGAKLPESRSMRVFLWYFIAIGIGYILIEVALIQKFVLFLGHPTYSLTVVIFSLLVSSGLGSFLSRRVLKDSDLYLRIGLATIFILASGLAFTLTSFLGRAVGLPLPAKVLMSVLIIAPLGLAMGMPFPTGIRKLEERFSPAVRWAWSLNAAASVLGSVTAVFVAIHLGLRLTLVLGGLMYIGASVIIWIIAPGSSTTPNTGRLSGKTIPALSE